MTISPERLRELGGLAPHIYDFLAGDFNFDWDLDHLDAEAVYAEVLDRLLPSERSLYLSEARLLRHTLTDDEAVLRFLRWVGVGMDPEEDFGLRPVAWFGALVERLERPPGSAEVPRGSDGMP
ncbi:MULTISPECIES: hypothetical protein [unclassified Curtobacterium]|uniref:hypothetical protein n=1 Tax=unclassified Curtobacterium TaxID=257496 RepID=UPI0037F12AE2